MPWINPSERMVDGTTVRVFENTDRNRHGSMRYMIHVLNAKGEAIHTEFCDQSRWLGHCMGQLVLPEVVANSRKQCAVEPCPTPTLCNDFSACDARQIANEIGDITKTQERT